MEARADAGLRITLTLTPKKRKAAKRIKRALKAGRKLTAEVTGRLIDAAGNEYTQDLTARVVRG